MKSGAVGHNFEREQPKNHPSLVWYISISWVPFEVKFNGSTVDYNKLLNTQPDWLGLLVCKANFNNISVVLWMWRSILSVYKNWIKSLTNSNINNSSRIAGSYGTVVIKIKYGYKNWLKYSNNMWIHRTIEPAVT